MRRPVPLLALALAVALTACGVPADDAPRGVSPGDVAAAGRDTTATDQFSVPVGRQAVFFLLHEQLHAVARPADGGGRAGRVRSALRELFEGPTATEAGGGSRSALPPTVELLGVDVSSTFATVDMNAEFAGLPGDVQVQALAQIVYTATAVGGVRWVRIALDGELAAAPVAGGELTEEPLRRADYAAVTQPSNTAATATASP